MKYLIKAEDIAIAINHFQSKQILWLDTEVADFQTKNPQLSLISILDDPTDLEGDKVYILDVLNYPQLVDDFINKIMINPEIEKVFHNAKYDSKFLGKTKIKNLTCTLEIAKSIPYYLLATPDFTLKTLAEKLCNFQNIDKSEQSSDWKMRPLTEKQLIYAQMDVVYLAQIHQRLLQFSMMAHPDPEKENINALILRYRQLEHRWKQLDSEINHLKERLKKAMATQEITEFQGFKLSSQNRINKKTSFQELAKLIQESQVDLDFTINLTQPIQKQLGSYLENLSIEEDVSNFLMLKITNTDEDDLPF